MVVASVVLGASVALPQRPDFAKADADTVRLPPAAFPDLPAPVRADLERRGCTVPQPFVRRSSPQNVVRGRFLSPVSRDIAVLCSKTKRSAILVYRGGTAPAAAALADLPDANFLQVVDGAGAIGFSRALSAATPQRITHHGAREPPAALSTDHDGIEDAFLEKSSSIWYWSGGKWLELPGAD